MRSARLALWLGGGECIRGNVLHNYWGNIPVTTLIFLSSLIPRGRHHEVILEDLIIRVRLEAQDQADAAQDRVAQVEAQIRSLQQEMGDLLHAKMDYEGTAAQDMDSASAGSETDAVDNRKSGGQPLDVGDDELAPAPEPEEAALHKVQWIEHLLVDNVGRPQYPRENCGNFDRHRWVRPVCARLFFNYQRG